MDELVKRQDVIDVVAKSYRYESDRMTALQELPTVDMATESWILCSERLPENERDVEITYTIQRYLTGEIWYLTARAFYEDGTLNTEDSAYSWEETDNWEIDEETDSCIVPEGWYESVSFTEEFGIIDRPVIAWRPIAKPYKPRIDS